MMFMAKKSKNTTLTKKSFFVIIVAQTVIFIVALIALFTYTSTRTANWQVPPTEFVKSIESAISELTQETSLVSDTSYQYIPEVKLKFKSINGARLVYAYEPGNTEIGTLPIITFSSSEIKRAALIELYKYNQYTPGNNMQVLDRVPGVQNCNRIYILSYDDDISDYYNDYIREQTLDVSGRKLNLWRNTGSLCERGQDAALVDDILQSIRSVEEY